MNIKLTLGERLKDLRVERNLKLETLAEQTGLSKSALSKYESDDVTDLSIYAVTTLAEFYGVTTDYLLGVTENKKRPDAVLSDLHLSDGAVDVLRNGKFNHRLLCELIVHENFQRFMTDLEIYVDGYVSANIQNLNAGLEATRQMLKKKYAADENDLYMSTLKLGQIDEDEYFGRVLYDELVAILKNIKTEHRKDKTTADPQPTLDDVKEKFAQALEQGSQEEVVIHEFCDRMQIPFEKISSEDFSAFLRILSLSKQLKSSNNMRGKASPIPPNRKAVAVLCAQAEETQITGKPPNLYRWTAFDPFVGGIKYVVIHPLADRFHQLFHKLPETDAIFEAQPVKEALAFCTRIENRITVVSYSVLLFLRQCADRFFILGFQTKVICFFLLAGFCLPPLSKLALHPLLNHQINQFFNICTHKRPPYAGRI